MATDRTAALVGATGGAGTTRLTVETAAAIARTDRRVAVFDAAFATQGLVEYVEQTVETDVTDLVSGRGVDPADAMVELPVDAPGSVHLAPARAPFAAIAAAKTTEAARRFEAAIREAGTAFDAVLVDTPPVTANQAVAAVSAADHVAAIAPATDHGIDALQRLRGRIDDVGARVDTVIANRGDREAADVAIPGSSTTRPADAPVADRTDGEFTAAVGDLVAELIGIDLDLSDSGGGLLDGTLR